MNIKITMRYQVTPIGMAKIKKQWGEKKTWRRGEKYKLAESLWKIICSPAKPIHNSQEIKIESG